MEERNCIAVDAGDRRVMLFAIEGFSQAKLLELRETTGVIIDIIDCVILRWIVLMKGLELMQKIYVDGREFVWIDSALIISHIPLLRIHNKEVVCRRLRKLVSVGLLGSLVRRLGKGKGTKTYYAITENLRDLIVDRKNTDDSKVLPNAIQTTGKSLHETTQKSCQSKKKRKITGDLSKESPCGGKDMALEYINLAGLLATLIEERDSKYFAGKNREKTVGTWAYDIRKLFEIDRRDLVQIEAVVRWCQADAFWQSNILSASKLRKQYPQLLAKSGIANRAGDTPRSSKRRCPSCGQVVTYAAAFCTKCNSKMEVFAS